MTKKHTLLIATTNKGKMEEIRAKLASQHFELLTLADLPSGIVEPEETGATIEENALLKAKYYAEKSGHLTLADDTGLFIHALGGWPGIYPARELQKETEDFAVLREKLAGVSDRRAAFRCAIALHDPKNDSSFVARGELAGEILEEPSTGDENTWGYNRMFYVPEKGKSYAEMTVTEKNSVSHRAQALHKMEYQLRNQYGGKHVLAPVAIIINDGKLLMSLRNDPHRPAFHKKWEFPGGGMEMGESCIENVVRETKEETGYDVEVIKQLGNIYSKEIFVEGQFHYQLYLIPYLCKIVGGEPVTADEEVLEMRWFDLEEALTYDLLPDNDTLLRPIIPEIKRLIQEHNL